MNAKLTRALNGKGILSIAPDVEPTAQLNYQRKVAELLSTIDPEQAKSCDVVIEHDAWCKSQRGIAECDCSPRVSLIPKAAVPLLPPLGGDQ